MIRALCVLVPVLLAVCAEVWPQAEGADAFIQQRRELAQRKRRIIFNNDGNEVIYYPDKLAVTTENVLAQRTSPLLGSQVDAIFYCPISSGFSYFTHNTKTGTVLEHSLFGKRNIARDLINQGTDALRMIVDFGRANKIEVFFSMRMNDTHDGAHTPQNPYPLFPPLKAAHPEYLIGTLDKRPAHGQWSAVDYGRPEVRELAFTYLQEVCREYDVDGVEMDFLRHLCYFKSVAFGGRASQEECDQMTAFVRRVRAMADTEGRRRGRPILIAVRVPDSAEYGRAVGLNFEQWLSEGLVDLLSASCYFQLNPWEALVNLGHKYNVPVYPCLSESRVQADAPPHRRSSLESYRARAARVWQSGADGVYLFNYFNAASPLFRELGDPELLAGLDKTYFVTVRNGSPESPLKGGRALQTVPVLTPDNPAPLRHDQPVTLTLQLGELPRPDGVAQPTSTLFLLCPMASAPAVRLNGATLTGGKRTDPYWEYSVPFAALRPGGNSVAVQPGEAPQAANPGGWDHVWTGASKPALPWGGKPGSNCVVEATEGALRVADRGTGPGEYCYFSYPWCANPGTEAVAEVEVQVVSGTNSIMFSNGTSLDRVLLYPDRIRLYSTGLTVQRATNDTFHTYRIVLRGQDAQVLVDGQLLLDGTGKFTQATPDGRNALQFGAASSTETGEALWRAVRVRTGSAALFDLLLRVDHP